MTTKSYPNITADYKTDFDKWAEEITDWAKEATRNREEDIGDFDKLAATYMRGRKVGKVPSNADDVDADDRVGDFNYDENYYYLLIQTVPNTVKWGRWDLSTANPWAGATVAAEDVTYDNSTSGLSATNVQDALDEIVADFPSGMTLINTYSAIKTDTSTIASSTPTDVSGLSITLSPTSVDSKFYIVSHISGGSSSNNVSRNIYLVRDSTSLLNGDAAGSRTTSAAAFMTNSTANSHVSLSLSYIDSPNTTSSTTYKIQVSSNSGNYEINRSGTGNTDNANYSRTTSTLFIMEFA